MLDANPLTSEQAPHLHILVDFDSTLGYPLASARSSAIPYPVENLSVVNEYGNNSYAPFTARNISVQGLPAAGISNRYLADSLDYPNHLRFNTNALLSTQPQAFDTGAFDLTNPSCAEGRHGSDHASLQYSTGPSSYSSRPFTTHAGINNFAVGSTSYTNGQAIANNPVHMPVSNNRILPLDMGLMTEDPFALPPNMYTTAQASANYPYPMHESNNPIASMDIGLITEGPFALSPNIYNTEQASANNPPPIPASSRALNPVDIRPPVPQRALCKKCNQTVKRPSDLKRHALKHGPKNIKCQVHGCKYRTYRKDKIGEHMRRHHPAAGSHSN